MAVEPAGPSLRRVMAVVLAASAGFVDAAGFLALDLFSAHMSGNSARLGVYIGTGWLARAAPSAFAIVVFVIGIGLGTLAVELLSRAGVRSPTGPVLVVEVGLLIVLALAGGAVAVNGRIPRDPADVFYPLSSLAVLAMGLQTSTLQRISGRTVRTTYVSGMLTSLAAEVVAVLLGPAETGKDAGSYIEGELGIFQGSASLSRIRLILAIWGAYAGAAILGGYLERRIGMVSLVVPCLLLSAVAIIELGLAARW